MDQDLRNGIGGRVEQVLDRDGGALVRLPACQALAGGEVDERGDVAAVLFGRVHDYFELLGAGAGSGPRGRALLTVDEGAVGFEGSVSRVS